MPGFADEGSVHHTNLVSPSYPEERRTAHSAKFSREGILYVAAAMLNLLDFPLCNAVRAALLLTVAASVGGCKAGLSYLAQVATSLPILAKDFHPTVKFDNASRDLE